MNSDARVYVAGHRGLVGSAIVRLVESTGGGEAAEVAVRSFVRELRGAPR